jgi:hypothetical protein
MSQTFKSTIERRAELMAELLFQDMNPDLLSQMFPHDFGYDLLIGFSNARGGLNTFAVRVKSTQTAPLGGFPVARAEFDKLRFSNIPTLLLVADVKANQLYYAWMNAIEAKARGRNVLVPVALLNDQRRRQLRAELSAANSGKAAG